MRIETNFNLFCYYRLFGKQLGIVIFTRLPLFEFSTKAKVMSP